MKLLDYIKKHYAIFVPIILIVIFILTYAIYNIQKYYTSYSKTETQELYTFFAGAKVEDNFSVKMNRKKEIIELSPSKKLRLNTIVYSKDKNKAIFPNDMTILLVHDNYKQFKVNKYAIVSYDSKNSIYKLKTTDYDEELSSFVLFDGNDLYFFAEPTILNINDEKINLSPMSYVVVNNNNSIEYYDNEKDENIVKDITNEKVIVTSNSYSVNLNEDKVSKFNNFVLLVKPSNLNIIK